MLKKTVVLIVWVVCMNLHQGVYLFGQRDEGYSLFYVVPYLETNTLDPIYGSYYLEGVQVNELIFSRLWTWNDGLSETPDLANVVPEKNVKKMLIPPTGDAYWRWRVTLSPDLKWPGGEPLTAEDVKFSFDLYRSDKTDYGNKEWLSIFKDIKVIDSTTLDFVVEGKNRNIARYVIPLVQILPKDILLVPSLPRGNDFAKNPVGSGPFQYVPVQKRKPEDKGPSKVVFDKNPNYHRWGKDSNINSVKVLIENVVADIIKRLVIEKRSEDWESVDIVLDIPKHPRDFDVIRNQGEKHLDFKTYNSNSWYGIALNCVTPPLNNRDVRLALTHAFGVERVIKDNYAKVPKGSAKVSVANRITGPFNPLWGLGDNSLDSNPHEYDLGKAMVLLDQSGAELGKKKKRYYNGEPIEFTLIYNSGKIATGSVEKSVIEFFVYSLSKVGISVDDVPLDAKSFKQRLRSGENYDMVFQYYEFGWGSNISPLFTEGDVQNITHFHDPYLDGLLKGFNTTTNQKQRIRYSEEIHRFVYDNAPYIFLYRLDKITAYRKELETLNKIVPRYFFTHISDWFFVVD